MATDSRGREIKLEEVRYYADYQKNWAAAIPPIRNRFYYESAKFLSIHGDAPKNLIRKYEYRPGKVRKGKPETWPRFIAKVGSKFYPNESIVEQLLTRIGQILGLSIADSELRMVGQQARFMSRIFLGPKESLVHGAELFMRLLDKETVDEITEAKSEKEFFTFQTIREAVEDAFPKEEDQIMTGLVRMIAFDAIIGHMDRHAYNWGVVAPVSKNKPARFSPVFDTARALFWNVPEARIEQMTTDQNQFNAYLRKTSPQIGWDGKDDIGHFELVEALCHKSQRYCEALRGLAGPGFSRAIDEMIEAEFGMLMSDARRQLISRCLKERVSRYRQSIKR